MIHKTIIFVFLFFVISCSANNESQFHPNLAGIEINNPDKFCINDINNFNLIQVYNMSTYDRIQYFADEPIGWSTTSELLKFYYKGIEYNLPPKDSNAWFIKTVDNYIIYAGQDGLEVIVYDIESRSYVELQIPDSIHYLFGTSTIFGINHPEIGEEYKIYYIDPVNGIIEIGNLNKNRRLWPDNFIVVGSDPYIASEGLIYKATTNRLTIIADLRDYVSIDANYEDIRLIASRNGTNVAIIVNQLLDYWLIEVSGNLPTVTTQINNLPLFNSNLELLLLDDAIYYLGNNNLMKQTISTGITEVVAVLPNSVQSEPYIEKPDNLAFHIMYDCSRNIIVVTNKGLIYIDINTREIVERQIIENDSSEKIIKVACNDNNLVLRTDNKIVYYIGENI